MPAISKIRFTNVIYEDGNKRYNDDVFYFDGENGAIVLENGGGKTVFIQTALQAILPHTDVANRKIKDSLKLEEGPAHIAIEWIISERPRRYALTATTLFIGQDKLDSYKFVDEYSEDDQHSIEKIPFVRKTNGGMRSADKGEMHDYYRSRTEMGGKLFETIKDFSSYIETNYHIITKEWESIVKINSAEGDIEAFFAECKMSRQLFERMLIPAVESTLMSNDGETFVDLFYAQRKGFKEYERFQETVRENRLIEEKLNEYMKIFSELDKNRKKFCDDQKQAKAYLHFYEQQMEVKESEGEEIGNALERLTDEFNAYQQKDFSYQVAFQKEVYDLKKETADDKHAELGEWKTNRDTLNRQYGSLKAAMIRAAIQSAKGKIAALRNELTQLDKTIDVEDLKDALATNTRKINGYFISLRERLDRKLMEFERHQLDCQGQLKQEEAILAKLVEELQSIQREQAVSENWLERIDKELDGIVLRLNVDSGQESVKDYARKWTMETVRLDEEITKLKTDNTKLHAVISELKGQRETLHAEQLEIGKQLSRKSEEMKHIDHVHDDLKMTVKQLNPRWHLLESLYRKEETLLGGFRNEIERLEKNRMDFLRKERIAYRYVDDYGEMSSFFADVAILERVQAWKNQFSYLETGARFLQQLAIEPKATDYPYWAITIITTTDEKAVLAEKVAKESARFQYPVIILSNDEAHQLVKGQAWTSFEHFAPANWQNNLNQLSFDSWKTQLIEHASTVRQERETVEGKLHEWKLTAQQLNDFFMQFPQADYLELHQTIESLKQEAEQQDRRLEKLKETEQEKAETLQKQEREIADHDAIRRDLLTQLEKVKHYMELADERAEVQQRFNLQTADLQTGERKRSRRENAVERAKEDFKESNEQVSNQRYEIRSLVDDQELYNETKDTGQPIYADESIDQLKAERKLIHRNLERISIDRQQLEEQIHIEIGLQNRSEGELASLEREYIDIDETVIASVNSTEQLVALEEKRRQLAWIGTELEKSYTEMSHASIIQETVWQQAQQRFAEQFSNAEPITFSLPLTTVRDELTVEYAKLTERKQQLEVTQRNNERERKKFEDIIKDYLISDGKFEFLNPQIEEGALTESVRLELAYKPKHYYSETVNQLMESRKRTNRLEETLTDQKDAFKRFCHDRIANSKLRDRTIQGLDINTTYEKMFIFQEKMNETILRAIQFAEKSMKDTDKDLEQFIHHMYTHIEIIVTELQVIPKKTKINVEGNWKTIYEFKIPEWDEHEAKQAIRHHVQSLVNRLEADRFKDDLGKEDMKKVRDEIEQSLHSRQLLHMMIKQQPMTVLCRKVTNDQSVTTRRYAWETTNNWSGGEKWSKNMTLFLGLLNYIAEKQQDVRPSSKRNRTVIVDNPFGKASSDHVLQPVFFIAAQLGFQIIALTAHVEGKFLRDYFPVIYSCRLRHAAHSSKQIVDKEEWISTAYFQDHNPDALERLGKQEQLELL